MTIPYNHHQSYVQLWNLYIDKCDSTVSGNIIATANIPIPGLMLRTPAKRRCTSESDPDKESDPLLNMPSLPNWETQVPIFWQNLGRVPNILNQARKLQFFFPPLLAANQCNGSTISLNATVKHNLRPPHRLPLAALESTSRAHAGWCCIMSQAVAGCHRSQFDLSTGHFLPSWPRGPPTEGAVWRKVLMQDLMIAGKQWFWRRLLSVVETKWFKWRLLLQQCALHHIPTTVRVGGLNHAGFNLYKWL